MEYYLLFACPADSCASSLTSVVYPKYLGPEEVICPWACSRMQALADFHYWADAAASQLGLLVCYDVFVCNWVGEWWTDGEFAIYCN